MTESQFKSYKMDSSKDGRGKHVFRKSPLDKANKREAKNEISLAFVEQKTGLEKLELEINKMTVRNICSLYMNNLRKYRQARNPNPKEQEPGVSQLKEHPTAKSHGGNETHIQQEETIRDRCLSGPITNREQLHDRHTQQTLVPTHQLKEHPIAKSHGGNETHIQQEERLRDRCVSDPITSREKLHGRHTQQTLMPTHQLREHHTAKSHGGTETHIQQEEILSDRCVKGKEELKREEMAEMEEMSESDSDDWKSDWFFIRWIQYMCFVASLNTNENLLMRRWRRFQFWQERRDFNTSGVKIRLTIFFNRLCAGSRGREGDGAYPS